MIAPYSGLGFVQGSPPVSNPCGAGYDWNPDDESCTPTYDRVNTVQSVYDYLNPGGGWIGGSTAGTSSGTGTNFNWTLGTGSKGPSSLLSSPWVIGGIVLLGVALLASRR